MSASLAPRNSARIRSISKSGAGSPDNDTTGPTRDNLISQAAFGLTVLGSLWLSATVALEPLIQAWHQNVEYAVTAGVIGAVAVVMIFVDGRRSPYSIFTVHWLFCFIFLFLAPMAQYSVGAFPWGGVTSSDYPSLISANYIILTWMLCWCVVSRYAPRNYSKSQHPVLKINVNHLQRQVCLTLLVTLGVALYLVRQEGINGLLVRGASDLTGESSMSSITLIVGYFGRAFPVALVVMCGAAAHTFKTASWRVLFGVSCCLCAAVNFPTATARFWAAALAIGLLIHLGAIRQRWIVQAVIAIGLAIVLPLLGAARHAGTWSAFLGNLTGSSSIVQSLTTPDFDAYSMVATTYRDVNSYGTTSGHQALTVIFFFVPRSIWPGKSVGSGSFVATNLGLPFHNVSCPLMAEGLINFGVIGVILFAFGSALFARKIEDSYWSGNSYVVLAYPFVVGLSLFIMRGDMLSSFAYSAALLLGCFVATAGVFVRSRPRGGAPGEVP